LSDFKKNICSCETVFQPKNLIVINTARQLSFVSKFSAYWCAGSLMIVWLFLEEMTLMWNLVIQMRGIHICHPSGNVSVLNCTVNLLITLLHLAGNKIK